MKNLPLILSSVALVGVLFLLGKSFSGKTKGPTTITSIDSAGKVIESAPYARIAYIDIDSLEAGYTFFTKKKAEFEARQKRIDVELETMAKALENDLAAVQKKAQDNTLTQTEYENAQKRLGAKQADIEKKRRSLGTKFLEDQDKFNKDLKDKLQATVDKYNSDGTYDYVLSYSKDGSSIIYVNPTLDITEDIVKLMNEN